MHEMESHCATHSQHGRTLRRRRRFPAFALALFVALAALGAAAEDSATAVPPTAQPAAIEPSHAPAAVAGGHGNSNTVSYWYGATYRTPFVVNPATGKAADIQRNAMEYKHVDFWSMGSNFADIMLNQSDMAEPASNGGTGATEVYVTLRSDLRLNAITHTRAFQFGPVRDVSIELGTNFQTKNSSYGPSERTLYFGPKFQFAVPKGYFNVGLHLRKEWNHQGVLGLSENYPVNFNIEPTWTFPFSIGKAHLAYSGFADYNTAKGKDSFGSDTAPEFLVRGVLSLDAGSFLFRRSQLVDLNAGLWYWYNEYGKPVSDPGAKQMTPFFGVTFHLDGGRSSRRK